MEKLVEGAVAEALRDGDGEAICLYVAACTERMAPLFTGLRANVPGRESDLDFYAESVRDLWHADRPLADAAERVRLLERFPELSRTRRGSPMSPTPTPSSLSSAFGMPCWPTARQTLMTRCPAAMRRSPRWGCWTRMWRVPAFLLRNNGSSPSP